TRVPVMVWEKPGATSPPVLVRALSAIGFRRSGRDGARTGRAGALRSWRSGTARAGTRSAGDRTAAPRQRGASLRSRSGTGAPRPVPTGRPAGRAPAAGRTPRPAAHRTPEDERLLRDARTGHRRRGRRSASGRLVVLDAPQQVPNPEGVQR